MADENGILSPDVLDMYKKLGEGGAGMIITGHMAVSADGRTGKKQAGVYSDSQIDSLVKLVESVKSGGRDVPLLAQISHAGSRTVSGISKHPMIPWVPGPEVEDKKRLRLFKTIPAGLEPVQMNDSELAKLTERFGEGAARIKEAGFDGVQIHAAHGYFISQTLSRATNMRDDRWGGSPEKRSRFLLKTIEAVKAMAGNDFPILIKINCSDFHPAGLDPADSLAAAAAAVRAGVTGVEVSGGTPGSTKSRGPIRRAGDECYFSPWSRAFKKKLSVPVILVGGIRELSDIENLVVRGAADLVSFSRPFIREPDFPIKMRNGKKRVDCISCNLCLTTGKTVCHCI